MDCTSSAKRAQQILYASYKDQEPGLCKWFEDTSQKNTGFLALASP